jgi:hypothetical protein
VLLNDLRVVLANRMQNSVNENLKPVRIQRSLTELQLDAKDADLVLAAKLGQTLLEQNEELTSENNRLLRKIEVKSSFIISVNLIEFSLGSTTRKFCSEKRPSS